MNRWIHDLPPNRTRRSYTGGKLLDLLEGREHPADGDRPEDWIASLVPARNPGLPPVPNEGLATLPDGKGGLLLLKDLIEGTPLHYLGSRHVKDRGTSPGFLLKLLDSATRLNVQAHPTREFARARLASPFGKLECYHVLDTRPGTRPFILLGFQHPPTRAEFRRAVVEQDGTAMSAWFDRIPVQPGETWLVPGGIPHAIGGGILLVELMEPSDLSVRFEFEREGVVVPPEARFLGRDVDFAMELLDFSLLPANDAIRRFRLEPRAIKENASYTERVLVDGGRVDCFEAREVVVRDATRVTKDERLLVFIVIKGSGELMVENERVTVKTGSKVLIPAAASDVLVTPAGGLPIAMLGCMPGVPF